MEDRSRYDNIIPLQYKLLHAYGWMLSSPWVWFACLIGLAVVLILLQPRGSAHPDATRRRKKAEQACVPPWERLGGKGSSIAADERDKTGGYTITKEDLAAVEADWRPLKHNNVSASADVSSSPDTGSPDYTPTRKTRARTRKVA